MVLFRGLDSATFATRAARFRDRRGPALDALAAIALGTGKYFAVATGFGAIVAVLDRIALVIPQVPAALLWRLLAFVTNDVPDIGFIIGLVPPAQDSRPAPEEDTGVLARSASRLRLARSGPAAVGGRTRPRPAVQRSGRTCPSPRSSTGCPP
ncbi:hypothetical protein [Nakamurella leprariae]|uniref:Uncharacterized protein n=1 Tax=Nakamurella leprariae TaxID=2803911 RepID=A0A938YAL6_9ACTN|nr:hypothetical protein [Nakamurella leprariae]MBM9466264.1 hypothetical protein [Nakamurella leprariae]